MQQGQNTWNMEEREGRALVLYSCLHIQQMSPRPLKGRGVWCERVCVSDQFENTNGLSQLAAEVCSTEGLMWLVGMWHTPWHMYKYTHTQTQSFQSIWIFSVNHKLTVSYQTNTHNYPHVIKPFETDQWEMPWYVHSNLFKNRNLPLVIQKVIVICRCMFQKLKKWCQLQLQ